MRGDVCYVLIQMCFICNELLIDYLNQISMFLACNIENIRELDLTWAEKEQICVDSRHR